VQSLIAFNGKFISMQKHFSFRRWFTLRENRLFQTPPKKANYTILGTIAYPERPIFGNTNAAEPFFQPL
jgi:hypothetical protein